MGIECSLILKLFLKINKVEIHIVLSGLIVQVTVMECNVLFLLGTC